MEQSQSPHESQLQQSISEDHQQPPYLKCNFAQDEYDENTATFDMQQQYQSNPSAQANQMDIIERCKIWKEQREKRLKEAQDARQQHLIESSGCTFQPNITRPVKLRRNQPSMTQSEFEREIALDNHKKGLDRYLHRMERAKEIKEQKQKLEDHLFNREKKWKPTLTQPQEPKLTAFTGKKEGGHVRALSKPVDILGQSQELKPKKTAQEDSEMRKSIGGAGLKKTQDFINMTQKTKDQYVEIKPDMTYDEAIVLIHQHILNLDL